MLASKSYGLMLNNHLHHNDSPEDDHSHVQPVRTLRPITQRQNETCQQNTQVEPFKDNAENLSWRESHRRVAQAFRQDFKHQEEVTKRKPGEKHEGELVEEFDVKHDLPKQRMLASPDIEGVNKSIHGGEE